jgi:hypothetical protein
LAFAVTVLAPLLLLWAAGSSRRSRDQLLEKARANWGHRRDRVRRMDVIAEYHRSRAGAPGAEGVLDDRTWDDLLMDAVFSVLDRTESTLGQQVFYHRLRSGPGQPPRLWTLLRLKGAPPSLVGRALERAEQLDRLRQRM